MKMHKYWWFQGQIHPAHWNCVMAIWAKFRGRFLSTRTAQSQPGSLSNSVWTQTRRELWVWAKVRCDFLSSTNTQFYNFLLVIVVQQCLMRIVLIIPTSNLRENCFIESMVLKHIQIHRDYFYFLFITMAFISLSNSGNLQLNLSCIKMTITDNEKHCCGWKQATVAATYVLYTWMVGFFVYTPLVKSSFWRNIVMWMKAFKLLM